MFVWTYIGTVASWWIHYMYVLHCTNRTMYKGYNAKGWSFVNFMTCTKVHEWITHEREHPRRTGTANVYCLLWYPTERMLMFDHKCTISEGAGIQCYSGPSVGLIVQAILGWWLPYTRTGQCGTVTSIDSDCDLCGQWPLWTVTSVHYVQWNGVNRCIPNKGTISNYPIIQLHCNL